MEAINRIQDLRKVSKIFFEKSLACTKISDVQAFFDLARQANADADVLEGDLKIESCWTYLHFVQYFEYSRQYNDYLEFCIRNRLDPVLQEDFSQALSYISTAQYKDETISTNAVQ